MISMRIRIVLLAFIVIADHASAETLQKTMLAAYEFNPELKAEREALKSLDENVSQALAGWRPTISASYQRGRQRNRFDGSNWRYSNLDTRELSISQPIFQGGATIASTRAAKHRVLAGRQGLTSIEQRVLLDSVTVHMDVVQAQSVLELSQNNEDVLRRQLQVTRDRFEVGEVTRTDVSQAEARLSEATANRINAEGQLQIARATFERVAGFKPGFLSKPITLPPLPPSLEETVGIALEKNPAVLSADYLYKAAGDDIDTSIADILPDVSIEAVSSRRSGSGVLGTNEIDSDQVLVNVTVPIYQAGAEYSNVRQAKVLWQQRKFESMDTENLIREASIQAWEQYQTSIATISANEDAIRAAEVALEGVRQEQQYGARTVLDILDAEQELFEARVNLVVSERNRIVSAYTLLVAVGAMNAKDLQLDTPIYDPKEHYNEVEYQLIGF